jgi:predicted permease
LFVRAFHQLERVDPGFDRNHLATFTLDLDGYAGKAAVLLKILTQQVRAIPGVLSVGTSSAGVMRGSGFATSVAPSGQRATDSLNTSVNYVSSEYFDTMGMHILSGRDLAASGTPDPKQVLRLKVVVSQAFVQRLFPNTQAVGKLFGRAAPGELAGPQYEIIGVVSDAKYRSLQEADVPTFYTLQTTDFDEFVLNVRTRTRPDAIIAPVRKTLASLDPGLPFLEVHTMAEEVNNSMAGERITAALASLFGGIAVLLVGVGIYGLLAYTVMQRRREIGIRMALGAERADVLALIVGQGFKLTLIGTGIGIIASLASTRFLASLLYGIKPTDPLTFVSVPLLLIVLALLACFLPARRATKVDPMVALRYE